jgi:hypothetical protein
MNVFLGCLLTLAVIASHELNARACSFPCSSILLPAGGVVPANIPAISFDAYVGWAPVELALTETLPDGSEVAVPLTIEGGVARLGRELVPGASYRAHYVGDKDACSYSHPGVTFLAGAAAPLPTRLGTIEIDPPQYGTRSVFLNTSPACYRTGDAVARRVRVVLDPEVQPWAEVLVVVWRVEGTWPALTDLNTWLSGGWLSATSDAEVFRACGEPTKDDLSGLPEGLAAGTHTVLATAHLVGSAEQFSASAEFEIACRGEEGIREAGDGCRAAPTSALSLLMLALALAFRLKKRRSNL